MTNLDARYKLCSPITNASTKVHGIVLVFASKKEKIKKLFVFEAFSVGLEALPGT
jgi:hypothetical protein